MAASSGCPPLADIAFEATLLSWLKGNESAKQYLESTLQWKLLLRMYDYLQGGATQAQIDACRAETTVAIAQYVRDHPRASPQQMETEIQRQVAAFSARLQNLNLV